MTENIKKVYPRLYCARPSCDNPGNNMVIYGDQCLFVCDRCMGMIEQINPGRHVVPVNPFEPILDGWELVKTKKPVRHGDKVWMVSLTTGGKRK